MAARLQRLEGMVRTMVEKGSGQEHQTPGAALTDASGPDSNRKGPDNMAQIVDGEAPTYVGATHFMAVLEDVSC